MTDVDFASTMPASGQDTAPAEAEPAHRRLLLFNRALKLLTACNEAVIRGQDETALLNNICRLIVERGGYRMAWVGIAGTDAAKSVRPAAQAGYAAGYLEQNRITWDDSEHGSGTSGRAIKTGRTQINQDFLTNASMRPWRASAIERGYQSCISLPLLDGPAALGVLTIYSHEPHAFDSEEASLLEELSRNLAYGIQHLREHAQRQAIEHELRESEQRFRVLVEHAPDAIAVFDVEQNRLVDANANAERLFQCSREELLQCSPQDFYPLVQPNASPLEHSFKHYLDRTLAGEQPVFERLVRGARGRETLCEVRLVRLPAGSRTLIRGSLVDITLRKKQEQELRQSLEANAALTACTRHLQSILDNLFAYVVLLDADGVIQEINHAPLERAKFRREEAIGQRFCDLPCWSDSTARSRLVEAIEAAKRGQTCRYDTALEMAGERIPIDFQVAPVRNVQGQVEALLATAVDITERHKSDEALRESESKFRILFESADDGLLLVSMDGRILDINRNGAMRLGYSKEEMTGRSIAEFDPPEFAPRMRQRMEQIRRDGHATFESAHMRRDGSRMPIEVNSILLEKDGDIVAFSIIRDITERKLAELAVTEAMQQMQKKELAKTRFLAAAGHDLRQPLMAANLYIDTLKRTQLAPMQMEIVERLGNAMGTFRALLDALLDISKFDAGAIKPEYSSISVPELLIWLEDNFAPMARNNGLRLRLYFSLKERLIARSDPGLLKSVLMNLVSNAIKFTAHGAVLLSARRRGQEVLFQIWDTGIGIADDHVAHIFDEFYQVNNSQRDRTIGLGLGLAIATRALALLGGKIACRSQAGRGSVFSFRLPLDSMPDVTALQYTPRVREESAVGKRFIVVEDDALVAQAICKALTVMGGEVQCFSEAEEALLRGNSLSADYYIVDYSLGGSCNGLQFLNQITRRVGRRVCAVLVTGDTSPDFVRSMAGGHWPVLHKPVNLSEVLACLGAQQGGGNDAF